MKKRIRRLLLSERGDSSYISSFVYILKRARRSSFSFFVIVSLWYNRDIVRAEKSAKLISSSEWKKILLAFVS